jgi:hypothetical protein
MSDDKRLLLEAAAIGAGYKALNGKVYGIAGLHQARKTYDLLCDNDLYWNPLEDGNDAIRLQCDLDIEIDFYTSPQGKPIVRAFLRGTHNKQAYVDAKSKQAALRLALVMVACEIGKGMQ